MQLTWLPPEVHLEIFFYLSVRDVMRIRQVCKLWNGLINCKFKLKQLRCYQIVNSENGDDKYDFYFKSMKSFLVYTRTDQKLSKVNYLNADLIPKHAELDNAFEFLNSFKFLKETRFHCYLFSPSEDNPEEVQKRFVVSLHRLEKASFRFDFGSSEATCSVLLDLPNLLCVDLDSMSAITLEQPQKLRTLVVQGLFRNGLDYSKFTSLMEIYSNGSDVRSVSANFIEKLPNLRELHLITFARLPEHYRLPEPSFGKAKPKIFFFGFEISINQINLEGETFPSSLSVHEPSEEAEHSSLFIARNLLRSIDNNAEVDGLDYNVIAGELNDEQMFGVMPQKFTKISHLQISGNVVDENRLLKFIEQFKIPSCFFEGTALSPHFFERFAEKNPLISNLVIRSEPEMNILSGDFNFVFKCKNLTWIHLEDCSLSLNFVVRAFEELSSIKGVTINQPENFNFSIDRYTSEDFISVNIVGFGYLRHQNPAEETPEFLNALKNRLNVDGSVCPKEIQIMIRHLDIEKQNALFWMRKYIYDQRHSICLSQEQMGLLNLHY